MTSRSLVLLLAAIFWLIYPASPSGAESTVLPPIIGRGFGGVQPCVSPDGKRTALSYQGTVCRLPAEGGTLTVLTRGEGWDVQPAWSPDGKQIAYINAPNFNAGQLRLIQAEDGAPVKLPANVRAQGRLRFHPDGKRLLGRLSAAGAPDRVSWFDLATGAVKPVEGVPNSWAARLRGAFALSPDGRWILFAEHLDREGQQGGNNGSQADLWKLPVEGGVPEKVVQFPARIYDLCWDAASQGCYVVTDLGASHNDLWHIPLADPVRGARKLTTNLADDDAPSVTRNGKTLLYTDNSDGATALVRFNLSDGERSSPAVDRIDFREPAGIVHLKLNDVSTKGTIVARISLKRKGGKFHAPPGALYRITAGLGHFYCRGEATFALPASSYEILAFRGPEYGVSRVSFELRTGQQAEVTVPLERWTNAATEGWYSGENHIHANYGYGHWYNTPRSILDLCEGEDLRVCNLVVANSDGDAVFDREFFRGRPDPLSTRNTILYWNQEFRATLWGHMTLFDLKQLVEPIFTGFKDTTNPWDVPTNADIAQRARDQGGTASYTHPTNNPDDFYDQPYSAKGLPVDAALGRIDTMDVMGWVYEPSVPYWYRLLNCGFRLPAAAGTDCFLNRIPASLPGWGRVYVHLPQGFSYENWIAGLKAGRSFVSNGPTIELSANGQSVGSTLKFSGPGNVRVKGRAQAQFPLEKLELVHNGAVIATGQLAADKLSASFDQDVRLDRGGWIALRVSGPTPRYWQGRSLAAHTNPIYVEMKGRTYDPRAEAEYFLKWIDRLESDLKQRGRLHTGAQHVQMQLNAARQHYRGLINQR